MADFKVYDNSKEYIDAVNKAADKILEEIGIEMERAAKKEIAATNTTLQIWRVVQPYPWRI